MEFVGPVVTVEDVWEIPGIWDHLWSDAGHKTTLMQIMMKYNLDAPHLDLEEVAFTLYNQAILENERISCPLVGIATDRRALAHSGETFVEDNVSAVPAPGDRRPLLPCPWGNAHPASQWSMPGHRGFGFFDDGTPGTA